MERAPSIVLCQVASERTHPLVGVCPLSPSDEDEKVFGCNHSPKEHIKYFCPEMHVCAYLLGCLRFVKNIIDSAQLDEEHREAEVKSQQAKTHRSYLHC